MKWWKQRNTREKRSLLVGFALLLAVALFLLLEPMAVERRRLSAEIPQLRADLDWMRAHVDEAERLHVPLAVGEQQGVSAALIETLLQEAGIRRHISKMQPVDKQGLLLGFNDVNFADLLGFMSGLRDKGYARVSETQVNRIEGREGRVSAELKLLPR